MTGAPTMPTAQVTSSTQNSTDTSGVANTSSATAHGSASKSTNRRPQSSKPE